MNAGCEPNDEDTSECYQKEKLSVSVRGKLKTAF
jgi:hypothetical protein